MRVRYQMAGNATYEAECDMEPRKAKKMFNELKQDATCEWAELVGEDDDDYMDILDSFDHPNAAQVYEMMKSLTAMFS